MALAIESGFPVATYTAGSATTWAKTITTAGPSLIVASFNDHNALGNATFPLTSIAGGGLTWTKITGASSNANFGTNGVEWWYAISSGALTAQTITATSPQSTQAGYLVVYSITGAASSPIGASAASSSTTLQVTVNAQAANSFVLVSSGEYAASTALTADTGNSPWDITNQDVSNGLYQAGGHALTSSAGNITVGASNTATGNASCGAVEILVDTGAGAAPNIGFRRYSAPNMVGGTPDPSNQFRSTKAYLVPDPPAAPTFWKLQGPAQQVGKSPAGRFRLPLSAYVVPAPAAFDPSTVPWLAVLPDSFTRPQWNPERTESNRSGWTQAIAGGIARDSGSAFPITDSFFDTNVATRTSPAFSTNGACLIVVTLGWVNNTNVVSPYTCTWSGGTPPGASAFTQVVSAALTGTVAPNVGGSSIWVATATQAIVNKSVVVTATTADPTNAMALAIDALTGASSTVTNTGSVASNDNASVNRSITLAGVKTGSWLYVAYSDGNAFGALTAQSSTTKAKDSGGEFNADVGYNSSGTSGSIAVGWTGTSTFASTCAVEIQLVPAQDFEQHTTGRGGVQPWSLAAHAAVFAPSLTLALATKPPTTWPPKATVLPDFFMRPAWNPERSHSAGILYLPPTWPTTVSAPESFARPNWRPERTETPRAGWTQSLWAVPPTKIPEPVLPERFAYPMWNPERTDVQRPASIQSTWAVPPVKIPDPVLPDAATRLQWNPERSYSVGLFYLPPTWPTTVVAPERFARLPWEPERSERARAGWTQALWAIAPTAIPEPTLPQFVYSRQVWSPDRSLTLWNPLQIAGVVVPVWGYEVHGPQRLLRTAWNPERSELARAAWTQALWAVPPQQIPEPVFPQFYYSRHMWNPERSQLLWNPFQIVAPTVPIWGYELLGPQSFLRSSWNPERTSYSRAGWTQGLWAVSPQKVPDPILPEWLIRPVWIPERSYLSSIPQVIPVGPISNTLPEAFLRQAWVPTRTDYTRAGWTQALWAVPPTKISEPVLPEFYSRPGWYPDRGQTLWNPFQFGAVIVPTWGYEVYGPHVILRPIWNPERTSYARAGWTQALWAVAPQKIPEPVFPLSISRPIWNPERSLLVGQPLIIPALGFTGFTPERFIQPWQPTPRFDLWLPLFLFPSIALIVPRYFLVGKRNSYTLIGTQNIVSLTGKMVFPKLDGIQSKVTLTGKQRLVSIMANKVNIPDLPLGDDFIITLVLTNPDGTAFDLSGGGTVSFAMKLHAFDTPYTLQKDSGTGGIIITNAAGGLANLILNAADSVALAPGPYDYSVKAVSGSGKKNTQIIGVMTWIDNAGKAV